MTIYRLVCFLSCVFAAASASGAVGPSYRTLSLGERIAAQRAIEQVYWDHRIWPQENPGPKPPLSAVMSDDAIRAKVEDYLQKSNALDQLWHRSLTTQQLQAELDRMVEGSRDPNTLRELFEALGNDPTLIAETLVRQTLADRLIHSWYASDTRFQGAVLARGKDEINIASVVWPKTSFEEWWSLARVGLHTDVETPASSFSLTAPLAGPCTVNAWNATSTYLAARSSASAVWTGSEMIVWGGSPGFNSGGRYNPSTDTWVPTSTGANVPAARSFHTAVWTGSEMIVWGGYSGAGASAVRLNTGGRYNPSTNAWLPVSLGDNVPAARDGHIAVWTGSLMIVWGGGSNTGGRYNPSTDSWMPTSTGANVPSARTGQAGVWAGSRMVVWGGRISSTLGTNTGARYDPSTDTWSPTTTVGAPGGRWYHSMIWTGTEVIVWGGFNGTTPLNSGSRYNPVTDTWVSTSNGANVPSIRYGHAAVWTGTEMIVWGGGNPANSGGRYNPLSDTWLPTSMGSNVPEARARYTTVWTGSEMIIWGGVSGAKSFDNGARYNPVTDSWLPTSRTWSLPSMRSDATTVWTGSEMIVWGGRTSTEPILTFNDGGRYSPATDSWLPVSTGTNVPSARVDNTAIWTGSRMIVWGGQTNWLDPGTDLNSGGSYDPATDSWMPTSTGGSVPQKRSSHTAVWTGTEMIVWGGYTLDITGGRYNPSSDSWAPTSTGANVPTPRRYHTAVWIGTAMIVWGGRDNTANYFNTGSRYDPGADTWAALPTVNAPAGRYDHTAVWTDVEMIVWGGQGSGQTGGRYNPSLNVWNILSTVGAPSVSGHTAVWTGNEMVVWGGGNTGGRYVVSSDSWAPISVVNAPNAGPAVLTPTQMIVYSSQAGGLYCVAGVVFRDVDGDGYGNPGDSTTATLGAIPAGYVSDASDCNDSNTSINPVAAEVCNGIDDNCNGFADEGLKRTLHRDADGDGYGVASNTIFVCESPAGWSLVSGDCNDTDPSIRPGAPEVCNGVDEDCDGQIDEGLTRTLYHDVDGDGYGNPADTIFVCTSPAGWTTVSGDCNDTDATVYPGAPEVCNSVDDNCNGQVDDDALGVDTDGDGVRNACDNCRTVSNPTQIDSDVDGIGNACDNCVIAANATQVDVDADGRGDVCDNCPTVSNGFQDDADSDRVGDACDNCPIDYSSTQSDVDRDGAGDVCDLNDGLIYVMGPEDQDSIQWQHETGPTSWNVYTGDLAVLRSTGEYTQAPGSNVSADRQCGVTDLFVENLVVPGAGGVQFSLVTGVTGGVEGTLGTNSASASRANTNPCP